MSETHDALESELAALRPREPSLELRQRITHQLTPAHAERPRRWRMGVAGGMIAAGIGLAVIVAGKSNAPTEPPSPPRPNSQSVLLVNEDSRAEPSLMIYHQALNRSPEALDALLAEHAAIAPMATPRRAPINVLNRSDAILRYFTGDIP